MSIHANWCRPWRGVKVTFLQLRPLNLTYRHPRLPFKVGKYKHFPVNQCIRSFWRASVTHRSLGYLVFDFRPRILRSHRSFLRRRTDFSDYIVFNLTDSFRITLSISVVANYFTVSPAMDAALHTALVLLPVISMQCFAIVM